jgi:hypothetical protein
MSELPDSGSDADLAKQKTALLEAIQAGVTAQRQNANKWEPLYRWFEDVFGIQGGTSGGVIGKVITESKQIQNRADEMVNKNPKYAVISVLGDVDPDNVLRVIRTRNFPALKFILFLRELSPDKLVIFDE